MRRPIIIIIVIIAIVHIGIIATVIIIFIIIIIVVFVIIIFVIYCYNFPTSITSFLHFRIERNSGVTYISTCFT